MKDLNGKEIQLGDKVVCKTHHELRTGMVSKLGTKRYYDEVEDTVRILLDKPIIKQYWTHGYEQRTDGSYDYDKPVYEDKPPIRSVTIDSETSVMVLDNSTK